MAMIKRLANAPRFRGSQIEGFSSRSPLLDFSSASSYSFRILDCDLDLDCDLAIPRLLRHLLLPPTALSLTVHCFVLTFFALALPSTPASRFPDHFISPHHDFTSPSPSHHVSHLPTPSPLIHSQVSSLSQVILQSSAFPQPSGFSVKRLLSVKLLPTAKRLSTVK